MKMLMLSVFIILMVMVQQILVEGKCDYQCVLIQDCPEINDLLKGGIVDPQTLDYLNSLQCGSKMVCCKSPSGVVNNTVAIEHVEVRIIEVEKEHLLPQNDTCQILADRIFGGNVTKVDEFPWTALLFYENEKKKDKIYIAKCAGSLISNRYILTAAHCIETSGYSLKFVRLGEWDTNSAKDCDEDGNCSDEVVDIPVEKSITHPSFSLKETSNDIALIRLERNADITFNIKPICLPLDASWQKNSLEGNKLVVAGWGKTEAGTASNVKLMALVPVVPLEECQKSYTNTKLESTQLCAGGEDNKDACKGDSGGPLMFESKGYTYLMGIVSFGNGCGRKNVPGIYTRVSSYIEWILLNLKS